MDYMYSTFAQKGFRVEGQLLKDQLIKIFQSSHSKAATLQHWNVGSFYSFMITVAPTS